MFIFKDKEFYKKTVLLMLPAILQSLITIGINFLDNIMVGNFGETSIAAAAFGNQFYNIFQFICMGIGSGAVVMSSQFWGRKEQDPMRVTAAMALRVTVVISVIFTLVSVIFPQYILRIYTNVPEVVAAGAPYMRIIGITFIMAGLSSTATYLLRSVSSVKIPLIGSAGAFVINLFFNWVFIFGKLGAPRLEIVGAAVGTLIARAFEFVFVFGYFIIKEKSFGFRFKHFGLSDSMLRKQFIKFSVPVLISDTLLGVSLSLTGVVLGHVGKTLSAANSIVNSEVNLLCVVNSAMATASAVVVGNTIGSGDIKKAKKQGNTYILLSFIIGLLLLIPFLALKGPYLSLYAIEEGTRAVCDQLIFVTCFMLPIQTVAFVISKGILRGGGDSRFLLLADSTCVWIISLPLGALAGLVWGLPAVWVYTLLRIEFPIKGIICFIRYLTGKWVKEIKSH